MKRHIFIQFIILSP